MGVPKFFRYISERYPCLSELVKEYQIPEFDNLYLDMNGIIHMCSHPDDGNPHFRITEEKIFKDIFHYIEVLFRMIKPQQLFFMAVDGVAPRAKMNQQRGRRFRSAKDAEKQETDALKKGEKLPEEARFDSNCITPGTVFMARLQEQLKYFVVDKISNDPTWQKCKVILSGQETPGEGEHKIMDYIRYMRAQPGYDPNTRHCLYGLDADLIMLGLCTHEPHFSLLREEISPPDAIETKEIHKMMFELLKPKTVRKLRRTLIRKQKKQRRNEKRQNKLDSHSDVQKESLERVIDKTDNLSAPWDHNSSTDGTTTANRHTEEEEPNDMSLQEEFASLLESNYQVKFGRKSTKRMSVPEEITFYLLHLSLMREYLELEFTPLKDKLKGFNYDFEKIIDDWVLMGFLVGNDFIPHLPNLHIANGALPILYKAYMDILPSLNGYINESGTLNLKRFEMFMEKLGQLDLENFEDVRDDLLYMEAKTGRKCNAHSKVSTKKLEEFSNENESSAPIETIEPEQPRDSGLAALIKETEEWADYEDGEETELSQSDEDEAFINYKKEYYRNKLEYAKVTPEVMRDQAEGYVRAIQWNLNYYYNGCCSWSWYYPHHYAPYISDIKGFSNLKIEFDLGKPFLPYEQLLGVLPTASKNLLPSCYHDLMTAENSMIKKYYPEDFQTDLNGKKQDWEAVVLVPFIDEELLLEAMSYCNDKLTTEEKKRNSHGPMLIYIYSPRDKGPYAAPSYFPEISHNHTEVEPMMYNDIRIPKEKLVKGAYPGVKMNVYYPGFPTMKHLKYKAEVKVAKIKVFETPSRNENMIITIIPNPKFAGDAIPVDLLGTSVFVGWPHLTEAKVTMISNAKRKFISMGGPGQYNAEDQTSHHLFNQQIQGITEFYQKRLGVNFGETKVLVHVQVMIGRKYIFSTNGRLTLEKQFATNLSHYPLQTVVFNISAFDSHHSLFKDIEEIFSKDSICFTITNPYYGSQGVVQDSSQTKNTGRVKICVSVLEEPNFSAIKELYNRTSRSYKTSYNVSSQLSISNILFSRITGSIFVSARNNSGELKNVNIGLDLKMNKKNKETPGYTKKIGNTWYYTDKSVELVKSYCEQFPEVFSYLANDSSFDDISVEKLFGENCDERLVELQCWFRSLPIHSIERQTCGSSVMEPEVVEEIEKTIDHFKVGNVKKVTMSIKPNFLYRPEIQSCTLLPDPKMDVKILDRIVNVRLGFTVPFGLKGTVIGIQEANTGSDRDIMYDVVFDKPFKDGMKLNCSENRGYRLPKTSFINISFGQRLMIEKTGKPDELIAKAEAVNENSGIQYARQQPPLHQQWLPPQIQPLVKSQQNQPSFNQSNSAFAQFSGIMQHKPQSNTQEAVRDKEHSNKPSQNHQQQDPNNGPSRLQHENRNIKENVRLLKHEPSQEKESYQKQQEPKYEYENRQQQPNSVWQTASNPFYNVQQQNSTRRQDSRQWQSKPYQHFSKQNNGQQNHITRSDTDELLQLRGADKQKIQRSVPEQLFMPNYRNTGQFGGAQEKPKEITLPGRVQESQEYTMKDQVKRTTTVDTNFLKNLLKIGENSNTVSEKLDKNLRKTPPITIKSDTNGVRTSKISIGKCTPVANAPASIELLTYYQTNALGMPRYQYLNTNDNMVQAQISLANGEVIMGKPAASKEAASENVAGEVLEFFKMKDEKQTLSENTIPSPPKDWVRQENIRAEGQKLENILSSQLSDVRISHKNKSETTAVLNNSFVPLQAVKNHISKSKLVEESTKENIGMQQNVAGISNERKNIEKVSNEAKENQNKPKKQRKTRIAANFIKKD